MQYLPAIFRLFDKNGAEINHYQCDIRWYDREREAISSTLWDLRLQYPEATRATVELTFTK